MSAAFKSWPTEQLRNVRSNFRERSRRSINSKMEYGFFPVHLFRKSCKSTRRVRPKGGRPNDPWTQSVFNALASRPSGGIFGPSVRGTLLRLFMWHSLPSTLLEPFRYSIFLFNFFFLAPHNSRYEPWTELQLNYRRFATAVQ